MGDCCFRMKEQAGEEPNEFFESLINLIHKDLRLRVFFALMDH